MSNHTVEIDKLERFNNRVREMMESSFIRFLNNRTMTLRFREGLDKNIMAVETELPDKESIRAFVPDFRLIYKHSRYDKFSLKDLHELYGKLDISELLKKRFDQTYAMLDEYLDSPIGLTVNNETPTNKELLDGFIYGHYLHETQLKTYQRWTKTDVEAQLLLFKFCSTLSFVLDMVSYIAGINSDAIESLRKQSN